MKSHQDLTGELSNHDLQTILPEILAKTLSAKDLQGQTFS